MKIDPAITQALAQAKTNAPEEDPKKAAAQQKAAREFEAIFLRQMLSSINKTSKISGKPEGSSSVYSSMVTDAMAEAITSGGGLGLADKIMAATLKVSDAKPVPSKSEGSGSSPHAGTIGPAHGR